jgi:peptide deformylase
MAVLDIVTIGNPILRQQARELGLAELESAAIQQFIDDLVDTMRHAHGAGLAANQVGRSLHICAVEVDNNPRYPYKPNIPLTILVNAKIDALEKTELIENFEGCLSVPNLRGRVIRCPKIRVRALDREGRTLDFVANGLAAGTYQHEVDHLEGILFVDRLVHSHSLSTWENYEKYHKSDFEERARGIVTRWGA